MTDTMREQFEQWVSSRDWFIATIGLARSGDEYADPCINSRWQGWQSRQPEIDALVAERDALRKRIEDAPVGFVCLNERECGFVSCDFPEDTHVRLVMDEEQGYDQDSPSDTDPQSIHREAWYAGMAEGPEPDGD